MSVYYHQNSIPQYVQQQVPVQQIHRQVLGPGLSPYMSVPQIHGQAQQIHGQVLVQASPQHIQPQQPVPFNQILHGTALPVQHESPQPQGLFIAKGELDPLIIQIKTLLTQIESLPKKS